MMGPGGLLKLSLSRTLTSSVAIILARGLRCLWCRCRLLERRTEMADAVPVYTDEDDGSTARPKLRQVYTIQRMSRKPATAPRVMPAIAPGLRLDQPPYVAGTTTTSSLVWRWTMGIVRSVDQGIGTMGEAARRCTCVSRSERLQTRGYDSRP